LGVVGATDAGAEIVLADTSALSCQPQRRERRDRAGTMAPRAAPVAKNEIG
jgi:hypothetical protein